MSVNAPGRSLAPPSALVGALQTLRERWWMVLVAMIVGGGISFAVAATSPKQYEASSSILVRQSNLQTLIDPNAAQNAEDPARLAATNLLLVSSTAVGQLVKTALNTTESVGDLTGQISASLNPDADIITITATDSDPQRAARLANAFALQFVAFERGQAQNQAAAGAARLRSEIASLPADATAQRDQLLTALHNVLALEAVTTGDATVVDHAEVPTSPSSPNLKKAPVLGIIAGLAIGLAAVFLIDLFDRRLKTIEEFEAAYDLRAIGSLPRAQRPRTPLSPEALESFRILRSALGFLADDAELPTVLVTSAATGEGKTTVAAGLAYATALSGHRVVLIEADLRRPSLHKQFSLRPDNRGLTTVLIGEASVEDVLQAPVEDLPNLQVLPSGPFSPHPSELLASREMNLVLSDLTRSADFVVIDSPPLLPVADSQVLLEQPVIDATLVVGRTYMTTRDQARRTRAILDRQRITNAALVVVGGHEPAEYSYEPTGPNGRRSKRRSSRREPETADTK
jgi:succinoglycan biosynthesis transport protein ExoP